MKKLIFTVLIIAVFTGCSDKKIVVDSTNNDQVWVSTVKAHIKKYSPEMNFSGTFKPYKEANLSAHIPGRIKKIHYREGRSVPKGAVIVTLSGEMTRAAQAELDAVIKDYDRIKDLVEKTVLPQQKLDHVQAKLEAVNAKVEMMRNNMFVIAPFNGVVAEHMMNEGEEFILLNPGFKPGFSHSSGMVRFMNIDKLFVEVEVSEKEFPLINKVKEINVKAEAYPGKIFKGKVYDTEVLVSTISRTVKVRVVIDNYKHGIKPGMFARVKMFFPEVGSVVVPRMSVARQTGSNVHYLFTENKGIVKRKNIKIVKDLGDFLAIEGIAEGENVVSAGKSKLKSGMIVAVIAENGVHK